MLQLTGEQAIRVGSDAAQSYVDGFCDEAIANLEATDKLLATYQQVIDAIPPCPAHGHGCIPYALEWIEKMKRGELP